ncbi:MAG: hypothetical protein K8F91_05380 [Candidatus Obscuribacterales bacterium]|nr:hypothetical protein [Candidatus Obscuribacterales bacterium]
MTENDVAEVKPEVEAQTIAELWGYMYHLRLASILTLGVINDREPVFPVWLDLRSGDRACKS